MFVHEYAEGFAASRRKLLKLLYFGWLAVLHTTPLGHVQVLKEALNFCYCRTTIPSFL